MSVSYSLIEVLGYLGNDPQPIHAESGAEGARFSLAVNRVWTDTSGQRQEETDWFTVVAWGRLANHCLAHLSKGSLVFVDGRPRIQRWTNTEGQQREQFQVLAERVIFLDRPEVKEDLEE
jgi:single-strand DNA-binding protein